METQLATINTDNYEVMADAMGMGTQVSSDMTLSIPRMKISHQPIMDTIETKGKKRQMEVVPGGTFSIVDNSGKTFYCEGITFRPFLQRFRYTRWIPFNAPDKYGKKGKFIKSIFVTQDEFKSSDLMDDDGGFNCGRPSGYIPDWKALPEATQRLIYSVKRVRALFGIASSKETMNEKGEVDNTKITMPVIWEINNKDAFKVMGESIDKYISAKRLLPEHELVISTEGTSMPNGNMVYKPVPTIDLTKKIDISSDDQEAFSTFVEWVDGQNSYITKKYKEKSATNSFSNDDDRVIEEFIDVIEDV